MHHECITNTNGGSGDGGGNISQCVCAAFQMHAYICTHCNANSILSINITKGTKLIIVHGTSSKCIWSVLFAALYYIYNMYNTHTHTVCVLYACVCVSNANAQSCITICELNCKQKRSNNKNTRQHLLTQKNDNNVRAIYRL